MDLSKLCTVLVVWALTVLVTIWTMKNPSKKYLDILEVHTCVAVIIVEIACAYGVYNIFGWGFRLLTNN